MLAVGGLCRLSGPARLDGTVVELRPPVVGLGLCSTIYADRDRTRRGGGRDHEDGQSFAKPQAALSPGNLAYHENKEEDHSHLSPLHDFEESVKGFVDFFVLFAFGAVNAGVDVGETGGFSFVVLLGLLIGKTLGMTAGSLVASYFGFHRPEGMQLRHLVLAGVISSVGLTVSLFIAGEAFPDNQKWESQAKMGALLSAAPVFILGALASCSHSFRDLVRGLDEKKDDDIEQQSRL